MVRPTKKQKNSQNNGRYNIKIQYIDESVQVSRQSSAQTSREQSPSPIMKNEAVQTDNFLNVSNIIKFVLATLIAGLTFSQMKDFCILNETESCSEKVFYEHQKIISDKIIELAKESAFKYSQNLNDNTIVSLDGAWDHRRHGSSCIVTMIDINSRKIIDFAINTIPKQFVKGTTEEPSRNLEKVGVSQIAERWKSSQKIKFYVHDNDGVSRNIITESGWKITEVLDPGHAIKAIKKNLENYNKNNGKPFNRLQESIGRFLEILFRNNSITKEQRLAYYYHIPYHYLGNHSLCQHPNNTKCRKYSGKNVEFFKKKLTEFLEKNKHYVEKVNPNIHTQNNECFNHLKTKYLNKNTKYSTSTEMRLSLAILNWNEDNWMDMILEKLDLDPLCSPYCECWKGRQNTKAKKNKKRRIPKIRKEINERRRRKLKSKIKENEKANGYKPNDKTFK